MNARAVLVRVFACALVASPVASSAEELAPASRPVVEALRVDSDVCLDRDVLAVQVAAWLKKDRLDRRIEVLVSGSPSAPGGVTVALRRDGVIAGERRFESLHAPCSEARAAIALAIALAIDGTVLHALVVEEPPPRSPALEPASSTTTSGALKRDLVGRRIGVGMSMDVLALMGVLPTVVGGVAPAVELVPHRHLEVRLSGLASFPESAFALGSGQVGASVFAGRLDGCAAFHFGEGQDPLPTDPTLSRLRLRGCAGALAGALHTSVASGLEPSTSPTAFWAAAALRFDARVALTQRVGLTLALDAMVPLLRPEIDAVSSTGVVVAAHPLAPIGGGAALGTYLLFQ